jgi:hypothetical protein
VSDVGVTLARRMGGGHVASEAETLCVVSDEEIQGRRVSLVPLGVQHADELAGLLEDAFVRDALGVGDVEGLRRRFAAWESRRSPDGDDAG